MLQTLSRFAQGTVSGQQAVTGSAVALPDLVVGEFILKALKANTINVYIGPAGITIGTGYELAPGEAVVLDNSNLNQIYVIASTTGASVCWLGKKVL